MKISIARSNNIKEIQNHNRYFYIFIILFFTVWTLIMGSILACYISLSFYITKGHLKFNYNETINEFIGHVVIAGIVEEIVFRGFILKFIILILNKRRRLSYVNHCLDSTFLITEAISEMYFCCSSSGII